MSSNPTELYTAMLISSIKMQQQVNQSIGVQGIINNIKASISFVDAEQRIEILKDIQRITMNLGDVDPMAAWMELQETIMVKAKLVTHRTSKDQFKEIALKTIKSLQGDTTFDYDAFLGDQKTVRLFIEDEIRKETEKLPDVSSMSK